MDLAGFLMLPNQFIEILKRRASQGLPGESCRTIDQIVYDFSNSYLRNLEAGLPTDLGSEDACA
jgi:hypothetical protein